MVAVSFAPRDCHFKEALLCVRLCAEDKQTDAENNEWYVWCVEEEQYDI